MPLFDLGKEPGGGLQGTALPRRSDYLKADKSKSASALHGKFCGSVGALDSDTE